MPESPLFTFVHVTDIHVTQTHDCFTPFIESLHAEQFHLRPDFVVATGDNVNAKKDDPQVLDIETALFKKCLERLEIPIHLALGNHDIHWEDLPGTIFRKYFPDRAFFYTSDFAAGFLGVFMAWHAHEEGRKVSFVDKLDWLDNVLDEAKDKRVLLFSHQPLFPPRKRVPPEKVPDMLGFPWATGKQPDPLEKWQAHYFGMAEEEGRPIRDRIAAHGNVICHYTGHAHVNSICEESGACHIVTASLGSIPCEYRHVRVFADRIEHTCVQPVPCGHLPAFYQGCVDVDHPTIGCYHAGLPEERDFSIRFASE